MKKLLTAFTLAIFALSVSPVMGQICLDFDDILPGQGAAMSSAGTTSIPAGFSQTSTNVATNSNLGVSSVTNSWSGMIDIDGDGALETLNFDIVVSTTSGNLTTNGAGLWGVDPAAGNSQINTGEDISFAIANVSTTLSTGQAFTTTGTNWFDFTTNGGGVQSFSIDGGPQISGGNNVITPFTADEDFTLTGVDTPAGTDANFRVRAASFELKVNVVPVPEPATGTILALAGLGLAGRRRRRA